MAKKKISEENFEEFLEDLHEQEKTSEKRHRRRRKKPHSKRRYFLAILVNVILWYTFTHFPSWDVPFISKNFETILPLFKLTLGISILSNFWLLFIETKRSINLIKAVKDLFSMIFIYRLYVVFPFKFAYLTQTSLVDQVLKIILIVSVIGLGVALTVELLELVWEN